MHNQYKIFNIKKNLDTRGYLSYLFPVMMNSTGSMKFYSPTHEHILTTDVCKYMSGNINCEIIERSKDEKLSRRFCRVQSCWDEHELAPEIDEIALGSFK